MAKTGSHKTIKPGEEKAKPAPLPRPSIAGKATKTVKPGAKSTTTAKVVKAPPPSAKEQRRRAAAAQNDKLFDLTRKELDKQKKTGVIKDHNLLLRLNEGRKRKVMRTDV